MTTFYSSKVHKKVNIPDNKVCGYTMRNEYNKRNASSGLRAGLDNGVVNQRLSRYATRYEAEEKHPCDGNRNWLNHNGPEFMKTRGGSAFNIARPSFKSGSVFNNAANLGVPPLRPNARKGLGNRDITRSNYIAPNIKGREILSFERLQAQDISEGGIKVQLGDKTIEKLFKVQVDDPTDVKWVEAKNARLAAGETLEQINANPPMGRPQRKVSRMTNFGAMGLSIDDKMEQLKVAVSQGNADNRNEVAQLIANTAMLLGNVGQLQNMTQTGYNSLRQAIGRMNIPKHWRAMGFQHRYFTLQQYRANAGLINLFLLSNLNEYPDRNFLAPIKSFRAGGGLYDTINIADLAQRMARAQNTPSKILDLQTRSIYHLSDIVPLINEGADDGLLNGQQAPAGEPNNGLWLPNVFPTWDFFDGRRGVLNVPANVETQGADQPVPYAE
jgi:hypothetical protein